MTPFVMGRMRGCGKAGVKGEQQHTGDNAVASNAAAGPRVEVIRGTSNGDQTVTRMPGVDDGRWLRDSWRRTGGNWYSLRPGEDRSPHRSRYQRYGQAGKERYSFA